MEQGHSQPAPGITVEQESPGEVVIVRRTLESVVRARIAAGERDPRLKDKIRTPYPFFNHMLETIAWRSCLNIELDASTTGYELGHVICEDSGWTLGLALERLFRQRVPGGIQGDGDACAVMDEAVCRCHLSFEGRARCVLHHSGALPPSVEGMPGDDLVAFLEGLTYGGAITLHLFFVDGRDPHHLWEAAHRALGKAIRAAFDPFPWRAGTTPGVKGF